MKKIRINNSIRISWGITINGSKVSLSSLKPTVKLIAFNHVYTVTKYTITENVITFVFDGCDQTKCGLYTLLCQYTDTSGNLHTIDSVKAFELVPHTCEEGGLDNSNLALEVVQLTTDIDASTIGKAATIRIDSTETLEPDASAYAKNTGTVNDAVLTFGIPRGKNGLSAYEVAKSEGFSGTKEEWLESLKGKLNPVLDNLDKSELGLGSLPSSGGSLYYSGKAWEWKTGIDEQSLSSYLSKNNYATQSWVQTWVKSQGYSTGSGSSGGSTNIDLTKYKWWGRTFGDGINSSTTDTAIKGLMSVYGCIDKVSSIIFTDSNFEKYEKVLQLDDNGDLCFNGNFYVTGGITALGSGGGTSGGSGASLNSLLTAINTANPTPSASGQVLYYNGSTYLWKDMSSASGGSISVSGTDLSGNASYLSGTKIRFATISGLTYPKVIADPKDTENGVLVQLPYSSSSSGSSSIQVATLPSTSSGSETWVSGTKFRFIKTSGTSITVESNSVKSCVDISIPYNSSGSTTVNNSISVAGTNASGATSYISGTKIRFATVSGLTYPNVTADPNDTTNGVLVQLPYSSSSGSGTTVDLSSYLTKTDAASTYAAKSHTHSTSDISGLSSYIQSTKVSNATKADTATSATSATKLATARTLWGQSFDGTANVYGDMSSVGKISLSGEINWAATGTSLSSTSYEIYGSSSQKTPFIDFHYYTGSTVDFTARLIADNENMLSLSTNSGKGTFNLNQNKLQVGNGTLEWDSTNSCFKINGSVYATGGITALGVSNSSTTTNNVDFTFGAVTAKSVTISGNDVQLTNDGLKVYGDPNSEAWYKKNSISMFDTANAESYEIFYLQDSELIFDPNNYGFVLKLNNHIEVPTDEDCIHILDGGGIFFLDGSTMRFNYNNTTYKFNLSKAIELGVLTT